MHHIGGGGGSCVGEVGEGWGAGVWYFWGMGWFGQVGKVTALACVLLGKVSKKDMTGTMMKYQFLLTALLTKTCAGKRQRLTPIHVDSEISVVILGFHGFLWMRAKLQHHL